MKKLCWCSSIAAVLIIGLAWCPSPHAKILSTILAAVILGVNLIGCFCCGKCAIETKDSSPKLSGGEDSK